LLKKYIPAFEIQLQPSIKLKAIIAGSFLLAIISCWLNDLSFYVQLALTFFVCTVFFYKIRNGLFNYQGITQIQCKANGFWALISSSEKTENKPETFRLKEGSAILGSFIFLQFESENKKINLVLANDSISSEEARQLQVALRVYRKQ
jgi:hypothetical protein